MDIAQADAQIRVRFIEKVRAALDPYIHGTEVVIDINSKRVEHVGVTRSPTKGAGMKVLRTAIQAGEVLPTHATITARAARIWKPGTGRVSEGKLRR